MNRCVKTTYTSNGDDEIVTYYKGCATTEQCAETAEKPFVECCTDDMCNKGKFFLMYIFICYLHVFTSTVFTLLQVLQVQSVTNVFTSTVFTLFQEQYLRCCKSSIYIVTSTYLIFILTR